jgi:type IV secretory pathway TrbF-like protein
MARKIGNGIALNHGRDASDASIMAQAVVHTSRMGKAHSASLRGRNVGVGGLRAASSLLMFLLWKSKQGSCPS